MGKGRKEGMVEGRKEGMALLQHQLQLPPPEVVLDSQVDVVHLGAEKPAVVARHYFLDLLEQLNHLTRPSQGAVLPLDVLLHGLFRQVVSVREQNDGVFPDGGIKEVQAFLQGGPLGLSEAQVQGNHQQHGVDPRGAQRQAADYFPKYLVVWNKVVPTVSGHGLCDLLQQLRDLSPVVGVLVVDDVVSVSAPVDQRPQRLPFPFDVLLRGSPLVKTTTVRCHTPSPRSSTCDVTASKCLSLNDASASIASRKMCGPGRHRKGLRITSSLVASGVSSTEKPFHQPGVSTTVISVEPTKPRRAAERAVLFPSSCSLNPRTEFPSEVFPTLRLPKRTKRSSERRLLVHLVAPAAVVPHHLVHHLQQPHHLAAVSPVLVVEHVVAVPASLRQPPERLSLALDVLLDRLLAQEIPAGEEHHGVPPNPLPEELHVLLHGPPVLHGEGRVHGDDEEEGVRAGRTPGSIEFEPPLVPLRDLGEGEGAAPPRSVDHEEPPALRLRVPHLGLSGSGSSALEPFLSQDGVAGDALAGPALANQDESDLRQDGALAPLWKNKKTRKKL
ncbi:hypothetical protein EYF80_056380 [Liparis tanakae]|uniref:Uncharacterized protein n=1 Tax=Liparis tanakae TaxID=230148 RepID=A0A4Z2EYM2_9TELE|nr:hypothetical protein EYF80_056380 [Liparis tanakae]